jgi:hypothetical protein
MERLGHRTTYISAEAVAAKVTVPDPQTDDGKWSFVVHAVYRTIVRVGLRSHLPQRQHNMFFGGDTWSCECCCCYFSSS